MKKEFIYFTLALMLFCTGFLVGKTQNDNGRYFLKGYSDGTIIFDTRTGIINNYRINTGKFYKIDIQKGSKEEYKKIKW